MVVLAFAVAPSFDLTLFLCPQSIQLIGGSIDHVELLQRACFGWK
jgi:hypothetical protein